MTTQKFSASFTTHVMIKKNSTKGTEQDNLNHKYMAMAAIPEYL
jgi:hypothetical protein